MNACARLRIVLDRFADREADPDESLAAARHLADCTACRIRQARARRLAEMLEREMADPVAVDDEFVEAVMRALPATPPRRTRRAALRLVRLGVVACLALLPLRGSGGIERIAELGGLRGIQARGADAAVFIDADSRFSTLIQLLGLAVDGLPRLARIAWAFDLWPLAALGLLILGFAAVGGSLAGIAWGRLSDA